MSTKDDCPECGISPEDINKLTDEIDELRRDVEMLALQRNQWQFRHESVSKMLTDILFHLPPQAVKLDDGRVMMFVDPDPARTLRLIQTALQRAYDHARTPPDCACPACGWTFGTHAPTCELERLRKYR